MGSRKYLIAAVLTCIALACALIASLHKNRALESTMATLQASLEEKEHSAAQARSHSPAAGPENPARANAAAVVSEPTAPASTADSYQILKGLESDPARLQELLADSPTEEEAAIACRYIFDKAADARALPDYTLQAIYASQTNPDLRRVIAQVLSQRGNDALINDQIAEAQAALKSAAPRDRLDALNRLGKIHSVRAVDAISPFLQDSDSTVRVAALFALRDSGNQRHVSLVEPMTRDPDPSVSTLAANVMSALRNLSSSARTNYSRADIEAELPPIANP